MVLRNYIGTNSQPLYPEFRSLLHVPRTLYNLYKTIENILCSIMC